MTFSINIPEWSLWTWVMIIGIPYCIICVNLSLVAFYEEYKHPVGELDACGYYLLAVFSPVLFPICVVIGLICGVVIALYYLLCLPAIIYQSKVDKNNTNSKG